MKILAVLLALLAATDVISVSTQTPSLEGVWRISEVITPAGNPAAGGVEVVTKDRRLPSVLIFTKRHFSQVYENRARTGASRAADPRNLTDAEKVALYEQWRPFTASAGTYELRGSTLAWNVIVAKNADVQGRQSNNWEISFEGPDAVWMIPVAARRSIEPRMKLTRLE